MMLEKLVVDNYLLIDFVEFDGNDGVSVFIGETGSGKSLFIEALGIILGDKFSVANIGTFRDMTKMSAVFSVDEQSSEVQEWFKEQQFILTDEIVITRIFQKNGKSTTRLNGEIVPVHIIRNLGEMLVDIHSQFDTQRLLKNSVQQQSIDNYVDSSLREEYTQAFNTYKTVVQQYEQFIKQTEEQQDLDYLLFQKDELEAVQHYDESQVEQLEKQYKRAKLKMQHKEHLESSLYLLGDDGIRPLLQQLSKNLGYLDDEGQQFSKICNELIIQTDELDYQLNQLYSEDDNDGEFEKLEVELQMIYRLQQKHGDDLSKAYVDVTEQIKQIEDADTYITELQSECVQKEQIARALAERLDCERDKIIQQVELKIKTYFQKLHLENIQFKIVREVQKKLTAFGLSTLQFQVASNNQAIYQPLAKVVSGGELSRIMLALKVVMLESEKKLMIFDEIDSGVSGKVAASIADLLFELSRVHQLFLITHSSLVAVIGSYFYEIVKEKRLSDGQYETIIQRVKTEKIDYLLAQLISQKEPSDVAIQQIKHLREKYE